MHKSLRTFAPALLTAGLVLTTGTAAFASAHHAAKKHPPLFHHVVAKGSFSATTAALKHAVAVNGMMVLGTLNQAAALSMTGLKLKGAESFFIGNPVMGKMAFQADAVAGMVIPVRVFVWVDGRGKTEIGFFDPGNMLDQINPHLKGFGTKMDGVLSKIVHQAAG